MYECLQYPLLSAYVAYRIQCRPNEFSLLLHARRLLQQFLVDMWASADQNRLNYRRYHQQDIRASLCSGLEDALANDTDLDDIGQRFILPSSYTGGPRIEYCQISLLSREKYYPLHITCCGIIAYG